MKAKSVHYCYQGYYYYFGLGDTNSGNWRLLLAILRRPQSSRNQTQTSHINSMYSFSTQPSRREDRRLICAPSNSLNIITKYSSPQNSKNLLPHLSCTTRAKGGNSFQMSHKTCNIFNNQHITIQILSITKLSQQETLNKEDIYDSNSPFKSDFIEREHLPLILIKKRQKELFIGKANWVCLSPKNP